MDLGLRGRVAIVAASSRGLGKAVAKALAAEGASLVVFSRDEARIREAADEIRRDTGAETLPLVANALDGAALQRVVDATVERWGRIDVLFNNAGGPPPGMFVDFGDDAWQAAFELNLLSTVRLTRAVLPSMRAQGWGRVLSLTSSAVKQPLDGLILSNSIRSGVVGFSKTLSNEVAREGITVNVIAPGRILTERLEQIDLATAERTGRTVAEVRAATETAIPMGRLGDPLEFANVAVFLCSEAASYVTGQVILVDGGYVKAAI